jgi:DNA-binding response OmpR family regulator
MTTQDQTMQQPAQTNTELQTESFTESTARRKRVLVVDDERIIADTLATIFRKAGYEAAPAYDGSSALSQCASFRPDLVISDVVMPGMNGIEMAILVKQRYPACKILMFSGQASTANLLEEARHRGYDFEILAKPVHPAELLARVTE